MEDSQQQRLVSVLYLATHGPAHTAVKAHMSKKSVPREIGQRHGKLCKTVSTATPRKLSVPWGSSSTRRKKNRLRFQLTSCHELRFRLENIGEEISDESYTYLLLDALTPEFQFVMDKIYGLGNAFDYGLLTHASCYKLLKPSAVAEAVSTAAGGA